MKKIITIFLILGLAGIAIYPLLSLGDASNFSVGHTREALNTSTGNQSFTITWADGGSYTPQAVMFEVTNATADATAVDSLVYGVGMYDGTTQLTYSAHSSNGDATNDVNHYSSDVAVISAVEAGAVDFLATGVSLTANTVTIDITNAPSGAWLMKVTAFAGADAVEVGRADPSNTDAGTVDKTGLGQSANAIIAFSGSHATGVFDETVKAHSAIGMGFYSWDGTTARQNYYVKTERNARTTTDTNVTWVDGKIGYGFAHNWGSRDQSWSITNHASGFTITTTEETTIDTSHNFMYLALALPSGIEAYAGQFTSPSGTGDNAITDPNFTPQAMLAVSSRNDNASAVNENATPAADGWSSASAISDSSYFSMNMESYDGRTVTSDTQSRSDSKISLVTTAGGTITLDATIASFDATGFTWNYGTTVNATNVTYLAFEENTGGAPAVVETRVIAINNGSIKINSGSLIIR